MSTGLAVISTNLAEQLIFMNKLTFTLLLVVILSGNSYGQKDSVGNTHSSPHIALHFSSPVGLKETPLSNRFKIKN
jgi:hypothetical protein